MQIRNVKTVVIDFIVFIWLMIGTCLVGTIGLFRRQPSEQERSDCKKILDWTMRFIAPASEKTLDFMVARDLVSRYYHEGKVLDIGFGAGRFEEQALKPLIEAKAVIDGIDMELEMESSIQTMQKRPWVHQVWKRSYLDTDLADRSYRFLFCNNGLTATSDIRRAFTELARITEDNGLLVFNLATCSANKWTYRLQIFINQILCRKSRIRFWQERSQHRIGGYYSADEIKSMLESSGWTVLEIRHYLDGWYMRWHYLFNFPAYDRFFRFEGSPEWPKYYGVMRRLWRWPLQQAVLCNAKAEFLKPGNPNHSAKFYVVARKKSIPPEPRPFKPSCVTIDVASACNLKCTMCDIYSPFDSMEYSHPHPTFMDEKLFCKIVDETALFEPKYCLQLRGEPLLHPNYIGLLRYCRHRVPKGKIFFNTNGLLLIPDITDAILKIGVDEIYISLDAATADTYAQIRIGSNYAQVLRNIDYLLANRHQSPTKLEVGVSFVVQDINRDEQEDFLNAWEKKVDYIIFYSKVELDRSRRQFFVTPQGHNRYCNAVNTGVVILVDGTVVPCCGDLKPEMAFGNCRTQSLGDILASNKFCEFRAKVNAGDVGDLPLCRNCNVWLSNEVTETIKQGILVRTTPLSVIYCCSNH